MPSTESDYLRLQYDNSTRLTIRTETHRLFSESPDRLEAELLQHLRLHSGVSVLDAGCGPGRYHAAMADHGAAVFGVDTSAGMLREARDRAAAATIRAFGDAAEPPEPTDQSPSTAVHRRVRSGATGWYPVHVVQADAQTLPFADASFDRILAVHMLYHVPDRLRALREFRRVLRPQGLAVLATNGASYLARLAELHRDAAEAFGYTPSEGDGARFTLEDLALVRQVFPHAERYVLSNALVFHEAEPLVRYYASGVVDRIANRPADNAHRPALIEAVRKRVQAIIHEEGAFRDPKDYGMFVAEVP